MAAPEARQRVRRPENVGGIIITIEKAFDMIPNLTFIGATEAVSDHYPIAPAGLQGLQAIQGLQSTEPLQSVGGLQDTEGGN